MLNPYKELVLDHYDQEMARIMAGLREQGETLDSCQLRRLHCLVWADAQLYAAIRTVQDWAVRIDTVVEGEIVQS